MLLNFLIALLSDTYANNIQDGSALFLSLVLRRGRAMSFDDAVS
jgi:hypothetical protein